MHHLKTAKNDAPFLPQESSSKAATKETPSIPQGKAAVLLLIFIFTCNLLASLDQSLMNIALDAVAEQFHISLAFANWLVLGFTIVAATTITTAASFLKRYGLRKIIMAGLFASLVGSLLGAFAWDFPAMIAARLIQAIICGLFFPTCTTVVLHVSPPNKKATLLAVNSAVIGLGLAFAPLVAGAVLTYAGLRVLFAIPAVISAALMVIAYFAVHDIWPRSHPNIDVLSIILSLLGLGGFILGLNEVSRFPLPSIIAMIFGLLVIGLFVWRQKKLKQPLLNLKPFAHGTFALGETLMMLSYMGSIYISLLIPLYLEGTAGKTPFTVGLLLIVPIFCYAGACVLGGKIEDKHGVWPLIPGGYVLLVLAYLGMEITSSHMLVLPLMMCAAIALIGVGLSFPTLKASDLDSLPPDLMPYGSSIHSTLVQIAGSIGSALFVGIMSADADKLRALGISKAYAYAQGFSHTLWIAIGVLTVALVGSLIFVMITKKEVAAKDNKSEGNSGSHTGV